MAENQKRNDLVVYHPQKLPQLYLWDMSGVANLSETDGIHKHVYRLSVSEIH